MLLVKDKYGLKCLLKLHHSILICKIDQSIACLDFHFSFFGVLFSWLIQMQKYQFDESLKPGEEDGKWWVRTGASIYHVRYAKPLSCYQVRPGSVSSVILSKRRKARIVQLASIPVLDSLVMFVTWCTWVLTRQDQYVWLPSWGEPRSV